MELQELFLYLVGFLGMFALLVGYKSFMNLLKQKNYKAFLVVQDIVELVERAFGTLSGAEKHEIAKKLVKEAAPKLSDKKIDSLIKGAKDSLKYKK